MSATCSRVKADATSSDGVTRTARSTTLAQPLSRMMSGFNAMTTASRIGPRKSAERSGPAMAMFLGTISPSTMCRYTTIVRAMAKATGCSTASGMPRRSR